MKAINCKKLTVAGLLGIGVLGALSTADAAPRHEVTARKTTVRKTTIRRVVKPAPGRPYYRPGIRPNRPNWNNRPDNRPSYIRTFNGTVLDDSRDGRIRVRADNGGTYTIQTTTRVRRGDRVHVSGVLRNGLLVNASVRRA